MILGFGLFAVGYAVFYWGIHHFPGQPHYSLVVLLGLNKYMEALSPIQLTGTAGQSLDQSIEAVAGQAFHDIYTSIVPTPPLAGPPGVQPVGKDITDFFNNLLPKPPPAGTPSIGADIVNFFKNLFGG